MTEKGVKGGELVDHGGCENKFISWMQDPNRIEVDHQPLPTFRFS